MAGLWQWALLAVTALLWAPCPWGCVGLPKLLEPERSSARSRVGL